MAKLSIVLALLALVCVLANVLVGAATGLGALGIRAHASFAVVTNVFTLFAWTVIVMYFIGAFAWVKETVEQEQLERGLIEESRAIRGAFFPASLLAVLLLIAAYVLGGGADTGAVPSWVHLVLSLLALLAHLVAVYRTIVLVGMALDLQAKVERQCAG